MSNTRLRSWCQHVSCTHIHAAGASRLSVGRSSIRSNVVSAIKSEWSQFADMKEDMAFTAARLCACPPPFFFFGGKDMLFLLHTSKHLSAQRRSHVGQKGLLSSSCCDCSRTSVQLVCLEEVFPTTYLYFEVDSLSSPPGHFLVKLPSVPEC